MTFRTEFLKLLTMAAQREKISKGSLEKVLSHLEQVAEGQNGFLAAHNLRSISCPPLEEE